MFVVVCLFVVVVALVLVLVFVSGLCDSDDFLSWLSLQTHFRL